MSLLLPVLAQLLHIALMLALAPLVTGWLDWLAAVLAGQPGPMPWQPWRELLRLARKQVTLAESASPLSRAAPVACLAATALAAAIVPSFTLGMIFAPLADLLVLAGLLLSARLALALGALDGGTALPGVAAERTTALACLAEPALFLVILGLGVLGGTTNLDLLIGLQLQGMLQPVAAAALAAAGLAAVALAEPDPAPLTAEFSGADLAMLQMAEALRRLVWLDLIGGLFLPVGMAEPGAGVLAWIIGLLAWAAKLAVLTAGLAALRSTIGYLRPRRVPQLLGIAAVLGFLAALLALVGTVAA